MKTRNLIKTVLALSLIVILCMLCGCDSSKKVFDYLEDEKYSKAISEYNHLEDHDEDALNEIIDTIKETYFSYRNEEIDYDVAISKIEALSDTDDVSIRSACKSTTNKIKALKNSREEFEEAQILENEQLYKEAISKYQEVIEEDPNFKISKKRIEACYDCIRQAAISSAEKSMNEQDYKSAITTLNEALSFLNNDVELLQTKEKVENTYIETIRTQIHSNLKANQPASAIELLNEAKTTIGNNEKLESITATSIMDCKKINVTQESNGFNPEIKEDTLGNTYYEADVFVLADERYVEYNVINQNAKYLSFTIAPYHHYNEDRNGVMRIYVDDELIWSSSNITRKSEPKDICIEIPDNSKYIKFLVDTNGYSCSDIMIANPLLWT